VVEEVEEEEEEEEGSRVSRSVECVCVCAGGLVREGEQEAFYILFFLAEGSPPSWPVFF